MTEYTHYHMPYAGRHGHLVSLKNDIPFCIKAAKMLREGDFEDWQVKTIQERAVREDGTCNCSPDFKGARWSDIMSHGVDETAWLEEWDRISDGDYDPLLETQGWREFEESRREAIARQDMSYTQGFRPVPVG